jgi:hypothetical protein
MLRLSMLIDDYLPVYDVSEHHEADLRVPPDVAFASARGLNLRHSPLSTLLFLIRGVPHLLRGKARLTRDLGLQQFLEAGFTILEEDPGTELVLGAVGRFWQLTRGIPPIDADEFVGFATPGYCKAVMNLRVEPDGAGSRLVTETRVLATSDGARRKFRLYWTMIGPFSALIRLEMLRSIKREADRLIVPTPTTPP